MNYAKHYERLVDRARNRSILPGVYFEKHHIIPRCMGGTDDLQNIIKLFPEEHYVAHQLLIKIYPENKKLAFAAQMMTVKTIHQSRNNKMYGWIKTRVSVAMSEHVRTEEHNRKISLAMMGHSHTRGMRKSEEHKRKMSLAKKNKPKSAEHRASLSNHLNSLPLSTCPHCNKTGRLGPMHQWHFENCKLLVIRNSPVGGVDNIVNAPVPGTIHT